MTRMQKDGSTFSPRQPVYDVSDMARTLAGKASGFRAVFYLYSGKLQQHDQLVDQLGRSHHIQIKSHVRATEKMIRSVHPVFEMLLGVQDDPALPIVITYQLICEIFRGSAVLTASFYAYPCRPATHITMGGLMAASDGHVYNDAGEMIRGLYAAGEITAYNLGVDGSFAYGRQAAKAVMAQ